MNISLLVQSCYRNYDFAGLHVSLKEYLSFRTPRVLCLILKLLVITAQQIFSMWQKSGKANQIRIQELTKSNVSSEMLCFGLDFKRNK